MKFLIVFVLLYTLCVAQIPLALDTFVTGTISPGATVNYTFTSPIDDGNIIVELTGPSDVSNSVRATIAPQVDLGFAFPRNELGSAGTDINGPHRYGVICTANLSIGAQFMLFITTFSSTTQTYGIRVSSDPDASLNGGRIIEEETCCVGSEGQVGKQYYIDVPALADTLRIFVLRDESRPVPFTSIFIQYESCVIGFNSDESEFVEASGLSIVELVSPSLQAGRYFISMPRPADTAQPGPESYRLGACIGSGCTVDIGSSINSSASSLKSSILCTILIAIGIIYDVIQF